MKKNLSKIASPGRSKFRSLIKFASFALTKPGFHLAKNIIKKAFIKAGLWREYHTGYAEWISQKLDPAILKAEFDAGYPLLTAKPLFSIIMPVYNPKPAYLKAAIESVIAQSYTNWSLCISDDCSTDPEIKSIFSSYQEQHKRIKVLLREQNGHISANSNSALSLATGEYLVFMDHDDLLTSNCLYEFARHANAHPTHDLIYSDEDKVDESGHFTLPHFKPDWAPDNLLSRNYIGHVVVMKKALVDEIGGFRTGFEGSQDYDLLLRATEQTKEIGHIPKVLYHWRIHALSVATAGSDAKPYAYKAAKKALAEATERRGQPAVIEDIPGIPGGYNIKYQNEPDGKVSIIIPTKDHTKLLKKCVDSILNKTDYPDFEIIVLNNNSTTPEFFALMKEYERQHAAVFKCMNAAFPFNFSKLMNAGVAASTGKYILMCNNDIEVIHADWMRQMVSFARRSHTGAVGVKLLYSDNTIQHAGVVLGFGGSACHIFVGLEQDEKGYFNYIQSVNNYAAVTAACMMCRKSVYEEAGGMDETLDVEYNDIDLCLRFLEHGYYNVYLPTVALYHYESATRGHPFQSKENWQQHEKNLAYFRSKWQELIDNDPFYSPNLSLEFADFRLKSLKETNV